MFTNLKKFFCCRKSTALATALKHHQTDAPKTPKQLATRHKTESAPTSVCSIPLKYTIQAAGSASLNKGRFLYQT